MRRIIRLLAIRRSLKKRAVRGSPSILERVESRSGPSRRFREKQRTCCRPSQDIAVPFPARGAWSQPGRVRYAPIYRSDSGGGDVATPADICRNNPTDHGESRAEPQGPVLPSTNRRSQTTAPAKRRPKSPARFSGSSQPPRRGTGKASPSCILQFHSGPARPETRERAACCVNRAHAGDAHVLQGHRRARAVDDDAEISGKHEHEKARRTGQAFNQSKRAGEARPLASDQYVAMTGAGAPKLK